MWKYITKQQCNEFLLSLNLISDQQIDKYKIKRLYSISNRIEDHYRVFKIKKHNGKFRTIYEPNSTLKFIQRQILVNILENREISEYAKAYHKNISLSDNAKVHVNKKIILKLDIKDFFNHITFLDIYQNCFPIDYFPKSVGMLLTYLCTYNDHLPQGAPTSSYISNLIMREFDEELGEYCVSKKISYTRYSDDMTFSGDFNPSEIILVVRKMLSKLGFELNNEKIHVISNSHKQLVTGIVVNKKVGIDNSYKKKIRQELYYIKKYGIDSHLDKILYLDKKKYLLNLYGRILFVLQIEKYNQEFIQYKNIINRLIQEKG